MSTFEERRLARAKWPIRAFRLRDEPLADERDVSTPDERLAMVGTLTREQWALSGRTYPDYARAECPATSCASDDARGLRQLRDRRG